MLPERHQWKPAVQGAAVMLRTPPVDGQSPASHAHFPYTARRFENAPRHPPGTGQQRAHTTPSVRNVVISRDGRKLVTRVHVMLPYSNATRAPIANPPHGAQPVGSLLPRPEVTSGSVQQCGRTAVDSGTETHTHTRRQTRVTTIYTLRRLGLVQNVITLRASPASVRTKTSQSREQSGAAARADRSTWVGSDDDMGGL